MDKIIIFGCGSFGERVYNNLKEDYDIEYFCDNNKDRWGKKFCGKKIISPEKLIEMQNNIQVIVASTYYKEILEQLLKMGIKNIQYYTETNSFLNKMNYDDFKFDSYNYLDNNYFKYNKNEIKKILFVQDAQCIRTYKIAKVIESKGIQVDIAYLRSHPSIAYKGLKLPYTNIIRIKDLNSLVNFVNESDYDVIHSSNEPDYLTSFLTKCNKPIVHDCHDLMSLRGDISNDELIHEFIANKFSEGNIYVDYSVKNYAVEKFNLDKNKPVLVLNNYTLREQKPKTFFKKLSEIDGEVHCVYQGGLSNNPTNHRCIEDKFFKLAKEKIHVHFYTLSYDKHYEEIASKSDYIHWEGNREPYELIQEMTQYNIGLVIFNVNFRNKYFLSSAFPNKMIEYLNSGLPLLVEDLPTLKKFVQETGCGDVIDFNSDINIQMNKIKNIYLEENFLENNKFVMEEQANNIINFYNEVKKSVKSN
ncbi:capsular biosynthesis protein [Clostridium botulinum A2B7 92]|uniref:capsular biosynthesis protein n=1 Tax=Clostridium botulinum TaxID=1491 RepID=UPI0007DE9962|nr:capsular biosynthesis protein [Clostridium botulinum]KEI97155.1 capsular biosynthesis protein [Clostridium botulinum A2B7 92]